MQQSFDIEEVLTIAIRIEVNGQAFYREAAKLCPEHAEWLNDLADQEISHEATYRKLKDALVDAAGSSSLEAGDYDDLAVSYLHSIAGSVVFKLSREPEEEFTGRETIEEIIDRAIDRDQDAGLSIDHDDRSFKVATPSEVFRARTCVVSIGVFGKPNKPDYKIQGKVNRKTQFDVTSSLIENVDVLVVGGGDSASEYVQHLVKAGCAVSISSREADFSYMNDENRDWIRARGEDGTVQVLAGTEVEGVEEFEDRVKATFKEGGPEPIVVDRLVYALGGTTPMNFLKLSGVKFDGPIAVLNEANETNIEGLYLVGDLAAPKNHGAIATAFITAYATANDLTEKGRWRVL